MHINRSMRVVNLSFSSKNCWQKKLENRKIVEIKNDKR